MAIVQVSTPSYPILPCPYRFSVKNSIPKDAIRITRFVTDLWLPSISLNSASPPVRQTSSASHPHVSRPAGTGSSRPDHAENPAQNCSVRQIPYGISYRCRRLFCRSRAGSQRPQPDMPPVQTPLLPGDRQQFKRNKMIAVLFHIMQHATQAYKSMTQTLHIGHNRHREIE